MPTEPTVLPPEPEVLPLTPVEAAQPVPEVAPEPIVAPVAAEAPLPPAPSSAVAGMQTSFAPVAVQIVDVEEAIALETQPDQPPGVKFFFGEVGNISLADETYLARANHATIRDQALVAKLREAAKNPRLKIFEQP